jgi:hypothetical protein
MFEPHPTFIQPEDENIKIWRYLDFTKLISLLDTRRLYFTRCDKFDDPFEGSWPKPNIEARKYIPEDLPEDGQKKYLEAINRMGEINKNWPRYMAVNCWHANEHESAAMWNLYLKSNEGIAIQSTYRRYKKSIIDDEKIFIGQVAYIDYNKDGIYGGNILGPFVHKRKSFEHEKEIRGLVSKWPTEGNTLDFAKDTIEHGLQIKVDIETLIERIHIAPNAPSWFKDLVDSVVKKYGYDFEIIQSQLNNKALF